MPIKERDIVLQGRDGGEDTIDFPITRLGNIESGAEVKAEPDEGDYIPLIDAADNEQMKKFPAQWLLNYKPGAWGTGSMCTLDLEKSKIGGSLFTAYEGSTPLSEEEGDVELKIQVSQRYLRETETGEQVLTGVELWAEAEASGVPRAFLQIGDREEVWSGKSWNEEQSRWEETPITLNYDFSNKRGLLRFRVTAEDGESFTSYVALVELISNNGAAQSVTYTSVNYPAELQYEADGVTPLTLGAEEAETRYEPMGEMLAELDPTMSLTRQAALSEGERSLYMDEEGKPIRRQVYRGWLPAGARNGILSNRTNVRVTAQERRSTAYMYDLNGNDLIRHTSMRKYIVDNEYASGDSTGSFTKPLIAILDTDYWDQICIRSYFDIQAEDGTWTYGVLELYNTKNGNYKLGRVELAEDGTLKKDPTAKLVDTKVSSKGGGSPFDTILERENWNGAALKEMGSAVDRVKDRFAVWAYDKDLPFQDDLLPNVLVEEGSWAEAPRTDLNEGADPSEEVIDPDHAAPIHLTAWVSPESEKTVVYARTEDPRSWIGVSDESDDVVFSVYQQKTMQRSEELTTIYEEEDPSKVKARIKQYYGFLVEVNQTAAPGGSCAQAVFHVKDQSQINANQTHETCGRIYYLDMKKGYAARTLTGVETLGEDLAIQHTGTVDPTELTATAAAPKGWGWVKLTAPAGAAGEEPPLIHVFRPNAKGQFNGEAKCLMTVYAAGEDGSPDLTTPRKEAAGVCWVKLFCPGTYHVAVTSQNGLWDKWGKEYTLTLTEQTEEET